MTDVDFGRQQNPTPYVLFVVAAIIVLVWIGSTFD